MPLITKIEELKNYNSAANAGMIEDTFIPCFKHVEATYLRPELGKAQYDALLAAYVASIAESSPVALSAENAALLAECRKVVAPLGIIHYKNQVISQVSDAGSNEKSADGGSPVRMWVNSLQTDTLFQEGMAALDSLLTFLEDNKGDYQLWVDGEGFTQYNQYLLNTTKKFNDEVEIGSSRRLFKALRPDIKYVELQVVKKNIGTAMYDRLFASDLTSNEKKLLEKIYPVIANYVIAICSLSLDLSNDGVTTRYKDAGTGEGRAAKNEPTGNTIADYKSGKLRIAQSYLEDMIAYLNDTASVSVFPEYFNSTLYVNPVTPPEKNINDTLNGGFAF